MLIAICKHIKVTGGTVEIHVMELWDRLNELFDWIESKKIDLVVMRCIPSVEVYYLSIKRLLEMG